MGQVAMGTPALKVLYDLQVERQKQQNPSPIFRESYLTEMTGRERYRLFAVKEVIDSIKSSLVAGKTIPLSPPF